MLSAQAHEARDIFKVRRPFLNRHPSENIVPSLIEENFPKKEEKPMQSGGGRVADRATLGDGSREGKLWLAPQQQRTPGSSTPLLEAIHVPVPAAHPWLQRRQRRSFPGPTCVLGVGWGRGQGRAIWRLAPAATGRTTALLSSTGTNGQPLEPL